MNDSNEWDALQDAWGSNAPSRLPDVAAMMARARSQRRHTVIILASEWLIAAVALAGLVMLQPRLADGVVQTWWWCWMLAATMVILLLATWTRLRSLRQPDGRSLRKWLALRRHRARLGLRLARLTRWSVIALLPAPLVVWITAPAGVAGWRTAVALLIPALVLAGGWWWARRQHTRLQAEIREVDALAAEWLETSP